MSYNLTKTVKFNYKSIENSIIVNALKKTVGVYLNFYELKEEDVPTIFNGTVFRNSEQRNAILVSSFFNDFIKNTEFDVNFNKIFINQCFEINQLNMSDDLQDKVKNLFVLSNQGYSSVLKSALSVFLLILHFDKVICLPFNFNFPYTFKYSDGTQKKVDFLINQYPPMFNAIRSVEIKNKDDADAKFIGLKNKEILMSYGSKLLLSLGWINFNDVSLDNLLGFSDEIKKMDIKRFNATPPYSLLLKFLAYKFQEFPASVDSWKMLYQKNLNEKNSSKPKSIQVKKTKKNPTKKEKRSLEFSKVAPLMCEKSDEKFFSSLSGVHKCFSVDAVSELADFLPEYKSSILNWSILGKSYINKRKLENYGTLKNALNYLNLYLFIVLPRWFEMNQSRINYPCNANELKAGIFVSKLIQSDEKMPITLIEFLNEMKNARNLSNESVYVTLKNLEGFFDFLQIYEGELPGCKGFVQPLSSLDFPKITRSKGTNKGLIPRYIFGSLVAYVEAIKSYNDKVLDKVLKGSISAEIFKSKNNYYEKCIDTLNFQDLVGFVPSVNVNGKEIVLKDIPNLLNIKEVKLKDGRTLGLPHPHLVNHILVVLQTGLRNNHIQWLDAEKYRSAMRDEDTNTFVPLYVNTDKSKTNAWTPIVNKKVIDVLDSQLAWRKLIENKNFNEKKFYNNNTKTKWGSFYPLFSHSQDGLPYSDGVYYNAWLKILEFFELFIEKTDLKPILLGKRLPKGLSFNEFNLDVKLKEYGNICTDVCDIRWTSDITPHSARVSVVSHYITALPADIIGEYVTGQTEAVVHHYVKIDPEYLTNLESGQRASLSRMAIQKEFNHLTDKEKNHPIFADRENSHIAQSLLINKSETITKYGCVSLNLKEGSKSGIDILIETSNIKMAFNKTEICPYNNSCPSDLIKELKGFKRCGLCPYAVRSIDHLPAIAVKKRQMMELLQEIENKLDDACDNQEKYSVEEMDNMEEERQMATEELLGWIISEEVLEANLKNLKNENDVNYIVKKPEILIANLQQVPSKENDVEYLLTRLADCESYPDLDTPIIRAKLDLLRRSLLARLGNFKEAFNMKIPVNPAQECLGVIKEVVKRYDLTREQVIELLSANILLNQKNESLIGIEYAN